MDELGDHLAAQTLAADVISRQAEVLGEHHPYVVHAQRYQVQNIAIDSANDHAAPECVND
eukprot:SAG31_NODE_46670_length_253_cov_0.993506_1_plen_59_part_10